MQVLPHRLYISKINLLGNKPCGAYSVSTSYAHISSLRQFGCPFINHRQRYHCPEKHLKVLSSENLRQQWEIILASLPWKAYSTQLRAIMIFISLINYF
ncbi:uncharacterized protein LAJ45_00068 [Morchella importuna]|uniref:uncharacterized protein n=1 Tax=Morchella importuna TaxID=1174673 RepID=UPI001E8E0DA2|nr:uncharacterized protein LAJ45_00068 [Morchella importuna]KAH8155059.1 hypothetical protein LAJ45_00068 [Morchella importuna]